MRQGGHAGEAAVGGGPNAARLRRCLPAMARTFCPDLGDKDNPEPPPACSRTPPDGPTPLTVLRLLLPPSPPASPQGGLSRSKWVDVLYNKEAYDAELAMGQARGRGGRGEVAPGPMGLVCCATRRHSWLAYARRVGMGVGVCGGGGCGEGVLRPGADP